VTDYPRFHRDRLDLLLHLVAVPVFGLGGLGAVASLAAGRWPWAGVGLAAMALSLAAQGAGHKREPVPPLPFAGFGDFVKRILAEQFYRFPRFVLSGGWRRALRDARVASGGADGA
jgi:hypothetical protein